MDAQLCKIVDLMVKTRDERDGGSDCGFGSAEVARLCHNAEGPGMVVALQRLKNTLRQKLTSSRSFLCIKSAQVDLISYAKQTISGGHCTSKAHAETACIPEYAV